MTNHLHTQELARNFFFNKIYNAHQEILYCYAKKLGRKYNLNSFDEKDVLQEFFIKILLDHKRIEKEYNEKGLAYLFSIIKNQFIDLQRKKITKARQSELINKRLQELALHECPIAQHINKESCMRKIETHLSPTNFQVIKYFLEGYSYEAIAFTLGMNQSTVGVRLNRIKEKLRPLLITHYPTLGLNRLVRRTAC